MLRFYSGRAHDCRDAQQRRRNHQRRGKKFAHAKNAGDSRSRRPWEGNVLAAKFIRDHAHAGRELTDNGLVKRFTKQLVASAQKRCQGGNRTTCVAQRSGWGSRVSCGC
jgi:hypothetical protein